MLGSHCFLSVPFPRLLAPCLCRQVVGPSSILQGRVHSRAETHSQPPARGLAPHPQPPQNTGHESQAVVVSVLCRPQSSFPALLPACCFSLEKEEGMKEGDALQMTRPHGWWHLSDSGAHPSKHRRVWALHVSHSVPQERGRCPYPPASLTKGVMALLMAQSISI